jgi:predicted kinase
MRRFDQSGLFDRLAERGALTRELMLALTDEIARFHDEAAIRKDQGGRAGIAAVVEINARGMRGAPPGSLDPTAIDRLDGASRAALDRQAQLLEARRRSGHVRYCHGDLHLRNICLIDDRPTLFDRIEFSEMLACTDVLYDLAFLLMDLDHRKLVPLANAVLNRYLDLRSEDDGLAALPLFLSLRAGVRAHVSAVAAAQQTDELRSEALRGEARSYLARALSLLQPSPPCLVAVGGLSGTGKTTLAYALAPQLGAAPGARVLRTDVLRKRLAGVAPETPLARQAYTQQAGAAVYAAQLAQVRAALTCGRAVIADAVFARPEERAAMAALAHELDVPFAGLWLHAPAATLEHRVDARRGDASDADVAVVRQQATYETGRIEWTTLDAGGDPASILRRAQDVLRTLLPAALDHEPQRRVPEPG